MDYRLFTDRAIGERHTLRYTPYRYLLALIFVPLLMHEFPGSLAGHSMDSTSNATQSLLSPSSSSSSSGGCEPEQVGSGPNKPPRHKFSL